MEHDAAIAELLAKPSLEGLAYLLRHPEHRPIGFRWNYSRYETCAIGLANHAWNGGYKSTTCLTFMEKTLGVPAALIAPLFGDASRPDRRPTDVADRIDRFLATTEF